MKKKKDTPGILYYDDPATYPTVFDYHAKVDILGWTFTLKTDGQLWIRTSDFKPDIREDGTTCAEMRLNEGPADMLRALLSVADTVGVTAFPPGTKGVGFPA